MKPRAKSPSGTVHDISERMHWDLHRTVCGSLVDIYMGWGPTHDPVSCRSCLSVGAGQAKGVLPYQPGLNGMARMDP